MEDGRGKSLRRFFYIILALTFSELRSSHGLDHQSTNFALLNAASPPWLPIILCYFLFFEVDVFPIALTLICCKLPSLRGHSDFNFGIDFSGTGLRSFTSYSSRLKWEKNAKSRDSTHTATQPTHSAAFMDCHRASAHAHKGQASQTASAFIGRSTINFSAPLTHCHSHPTVGHLLFFLFFFCT